MAGERTQNALLAKTEMFARLLEKKILTIRVWEIVRLRRLCRCYDAPANRLNSYPSLAPDHVDAALAYAAELAREESLLPLSPS